MAKLHWRDLLAKLIAYNTISSGDPQFDHGNLEAIKFLAERLDAAGFKCQILPIPNRPNKANLLARMGGTAEVASKNGLVFAGHIDTVPYDDQQWRSNPFELVEKNNKLYGLGVCDMKGFIALAAHASSQYSKLKNLLAYLSVPTKNAAWMVHAI